MVGTEPVPKPVVPKAKERTVTASPVSKAKEPTVTVLPISKEVLQQQLNAQLAENFIKSYETSLNRPLTVFDLESLSSEAYRRLPQGAKDALRDLLTAKQAEEDQILQKRKQIEDERLQTSAGQDAINFLEGFNKAFGHYPTVAELDSGQITNEAYLRLSKYAKNELLELARQREQSNKDSLK